MTYDFKRIEEAGWFAAQSAGIAILVVLVQFDPAAITDWKTWVIGLAGGAIRAAAAGALNLLRG